MTVSKLVRDRIPEIIEADGRKAVWHTADEDQIVPLLERKLHEEMEEFVESEEIDELSDILEVVYALADEIGCTRDELEEAYQKKHEKRGGFSKRIVLDSVED